MIILGQIPLSVLKWFVFWYRHTQEVKANPKKNPKIANANPWFTLTFGNFFICIKLLFISAACYCKFKIYFSNPLIVSIKVLASISIIGFLIFFVQIFIPYNQSVGRSYRGGK